MQLHVLSSTLLAGVLIQAACGGAKAPTTGPGAASSARGHACPDDSSCPNAMRCMSYVGAQGEHLESCEDPCNEDKRCPGNLECTTISGRGRVCR